MRLPREVYVLCAVAFSVALGFGIVAPALPLLAKSFEVGETAISGVVSGFALMRFVSALGGGRLVDRFGERRVMTTGIAIVAASSALAGLAATYWQLLLMRGVGGVGSAMFSISAFSLLVRSVASDRRARASSMFSGSFLVGGVLGPVLGGFVTEGSARAPFFVYAGTLALAGAISLVALPRHLAVDEPGAREDSGTGLGVAWRSRAYRAALATAAAQQGALFGVRNAILPLFVTAGAAAGGLGLEGRWIGWGVGLSALLQGVTLPIAGRYADLHGRKPLLLVGLCLLAGGLGALGLASSAAGYLAAMALIGPGGAMLSVGPGSVVADVVAGRGGTAYAAFSMAGDGGTVVGPLLAGAVAQQWSYGTAFGVCACVALLPLLVVARAPETLRRTDSAITSPVGSEPA